MQVVTLKDQGFFDKFQKFGEALGRLTSGENIAKQRRAQQDIQLNDLAIDLGADNAAKRKQDDFMSSFDPTAAYRARNQAPWATAGRLPDLSPSTFDADTLADVYTQGAKAAGVKPPSRAQAAQHFAGIMRAQELARAPLPDISDLQSTGFEVGPDGQAKLTAGIRPSQTVSPVLDAGGKPTGWVNAGGKIVQDPNYTKPMTAKERIEWVGQTGSLKSLQDEVNSAMAILNDPNKNVVGADFTGGNPVGGWLRNVILDPIKMTQDTMDQNVFHRLASQRVLEAAKYLTGPKSDKDIQFLKDSQRKVSDDESTWKPYLESWMKTIQNELDYREAVILGLEDEYVKAFEEGRSWTPPSRRTGQEQPRTPGALPDVEDRGPGTTLPSPQSITQKRFSTQAERLQAVMSGALQPGETFLMLNPQTGRYDEVRYTPRQGAGLSVVDPQLTVGAPQ